MSFNNSLNYFNANVIELLNKESTQKFSTPTSTLFSVNHTVSKISPHRKFNLFSTNQKK